MRPVLLTAQEAAVRPLWRTSIKQAQPLGKRHRLVMSSDHKNTQQHISMCCGSAAQLRKSGRTSQIRTWLSTVAVEPGILLCRSSQPTAAQIRNLQQPGLSGWLVGTSDVHEIIWQCWMDVVLCMLGGVWRVVPVVGRQGAQHESSMAFLHSPAGYLQL